MKKIFTSACFQPDLSMENVNSIGWFEIYVDDMGRAQKFYESVFQVKFEKMDTPDGSEMLAFPADYSGYGAPGALVKMEGVKPGAGGIMIYFSCDDCANEESRVSAAGGKVHQPKMSIGEYGFISMIEDSEGNMIGLHSQAD